MTTLRPVSSEPYARAFLVTTFGVTAMFVVLVLRLFYIQLWEGDTYQSLSENNRIRLLEIHSPRGKIMDVNHEDLADNRERSKSYRDMAKELRDRIRDSMWNEDRQFFCDLKLDGSFGDCVGLGGFIAGLMANHVEDLRCGVPRPLGIPHLLDHGLWPTHRLGEQPAFLAGGEVVPELASGPGQRSVFR